MPINSSVPNTFPFEPAPTHRGPEKAHDLLRQALKRFAMPEITALLDADDRDALTRVAKVLPKFMPDF